MGVCGPILSPMTVSIFRSRALYTNGPRGRPSILAAVPDCLGVGQPLRVQQLVSRSKVDRCRL